MTYEEYSEIRDSLNLKDGTVAARAGITRSTFTDWKNGRSKPKQDKMDKIMAVLNEPKTHITNVFVNRDKERNHSTLSSKQADMIFIDMCRELMEGRNQEEINAMIKSFAAYARASKKTQKVIDSILDMEDEEN